MTKTHFVKAARKARPEHDIKVGESYYWWKFRFGGIHISKTPPKRQQLTQSEFMSNIYNLEDELTGVQDENDAESIADQLEELADEQEDKRSNMPDQLQDAESGELLQNRADSCREFAENIRGVDYPEKEDDQTDEEYEEKVQEWRDEVQALGYEGE